MFRVTAMYQDAEVGYGEGDSYEWAAQECVDSISGPYPEGGIVLTCTHGVMTVETPLTLWREFA